MSHESLNFSLSMAGKKTQGISRKDVKSTGSSV